MSDDDRRAWSIFERVAAGTYRGFGLLNQFLADTRSAYPDASMVAGRDRAQEPKETHLLGGASESGSTLERLVLFGKVLLLERL